LIITQKDHPPPDSPEKPYVTLDLESFMNLTGKIAIVTGGGRGIGKGCALELAQRGADILLNDRPGSPDLETAAAEIRELGRACHAIEADVFSRAGCEELLKASLEITGRVDILISNPAYSRRAAFLEYSPEEFERTIQGTLTSGFHMSQLTARHMIQRGAGGKIVFISSVQAEMPMSLCVAYGAAKAGLNHMMRTIAVELSAYRIHVNAIEPGWIDTPGEHATFDEETIEREGKRLPWGRLGVPADIGRAAAFLASDEADYITGTVLPVDGGFRYKDCRVENMKPLRPS
jgi:glucose 1-dehydrogenase